MLVTFVFSACLHEYILALLFSKIIPIIFAFMMVQIPLIVFGQYMKVYKTNFNNSEHFIRKHSLLVWSNIRFPSNNGSIFKRPRYQQNNDGIINVFWLYT